MQTHQLKESVNAMNSNKVKKITEIEEQINTHVYIKAHQKWVSLQELHRETIVSGTNLYGLLDSSKYSADFALKVLSQSHPNVERDALYIYSSRQLRAFCSNSAGIIDQSRSFFNKFYQGTPFMLEWKDKIAKISTNESILFIKHLRNYLEHYSTAPWQIKIHSVSSEPSLKIGLNASTLLEWDKWPSAVRELLKQSDDFLHLSPIIKEYLAIFEDLWQWAFEQFDSLHKEDLLQFNALRERQALLMTDGRLDSMVDVEEELRQTLLFILKDNEK